MNKKAAFAVLMLAASSVGAQIPSPAQQNCNLLTQTVAATAIWRDNGVPLAKAQSNVADVLAQMPATEVDKQKWLDAVTSVYGSKITSDQISASLGKMCGH
jgi:hypothetical protein